MYICIVRTRGMYSRVYTADYTLDIRPRLNKTKSRSGVCEECAPFLMSSICFVSNGSERFSRCLRRREVGPTPTERLHSDCPDLMVSDKNLASKYKLTQLPTPHYLLCLRGPP